MNSVRALLDWPLCVPTIGALAGVLLFVSGSVRRRPRDQIFGATVVAICVLSGFALNSYY